METRTIILFITLFVLIVVGMFAFAYLKRQELTVSSTNTLPDQNLSAEAPLDPYSNITRINAKHFFIDGIHTFAGELEMPTPCDLVNTSATIRESYPEQVQLDFSVINNADMCAQVITKQRFSVTVAASEQASVSAVFNGRSVELNLIPAAPGETPEDFELFIKG